MKVLVGILLGAASMLVALPGAASPMLVDYGAVQAVTSQNFEGARLEGAASPQMFSGFTFSAPGMVSVLDDEALCGRAFDMCLTSTQPGGQQVFSNFQPSATAFGLELFKADGADDILVTIMGGSGVIQQAISSSGYFAFSDLMGITSITFSNVGDLSDASGYSFDDVITGFVAAPLPSGMLLLLSAVSAVALLPVARRARSPE